MLLGDIPQLMNTCLRTLANCGAGVLDPVAQYNDELWRSARMRAAIALGLISQKHFVDWLMRGILSRN
jgi:hypothetical protein